MKGILFKILICVLVVAVLGTGAIFGYKYFFKDNNEEETNNSGTSTVQTNSYNQAVASRKLTTANYSGTYQFECVNNIVFNEYSEDNKGGLTKTDIEVLLSNRGITGGVPAFSSYMDALKRKEVYGETDEEGNVVTAGNSELINIVTPVDKTGKPLEYATFTKTVSTEVNVTTGKVYGDENLAVVFLDGTTSKLFLSLNYTNLNDAISLPTDVEKSPMQSKIYVYEEVYSKNNPTLKLFTISYEYKLVEEDPSHPHSELNF